MRIWVKKQLFWWKAINPDEYLADMDLPTTKRSWSRDGAIRKWVPKPERNPWEEIDLEAYKKDWTNW